MTTPVRNRVIVTRAKEQAEELSELLRAAGFDPLVVPTIQIEPPESWVVVDEAIRAIRDYALVAFTSANAVRKFAERLVSLNPGFDLGSIRAAAIGEKTEAVLKKLGFHVVAVPEKPRAAEEFAEYLKTRFTLTGKKVLFPRAAEGRDVFLKELKKAGATVDLVPVYRTVQSEEGKKKLSELFGSNDVAWITFASGSAVKGFFDLCGEKPAKEWIRKAGVRVAVMGDVTRSALDKYGMEAQVVASEPTMKALVESLHREG